MAKPFVLRWGVLAEAAVFVRACWRACPNSRMAAMAPSKRALFLPSRCAFQVLAQNSGRRTESDGGMRLQADGFHPRPHAPAQFAVEFYRRLPRCYPRPPYPLFHHAAAFKEGFRANHHPRRRFRGQQGSLPTGSSVYPAVWSPSWPDRHRVRSEARAGTAVVRSMRS